jgi:integrase
MARRGRGEGSIEKLPSGSWRATLPGRKKAGRSRTFEHRADAVSWLHSRASTKAAPTGTVGEWLTEWLALTKPDVRAKSYADDAWRVGRHLVPRLGAVRLRDLDATAVKRMLAEMAAAGSSDSERQKAGAVLRKALNSAVDLGRLSTSPMARVKLPTPKRADKRVMTPDQLRAFVAAAEGKGYGHVFRVWADAGLRPQEMFALRWSDFDLTAGTLSISRAFDAESRTVEPTKTRRSKRTIPLASSTLAAVRAARPADDGLFLPDSVGGHWWEGNFRREVLKPIGRAAGVPWVYAYCFRHTLASILLSKGVNILIVSRRLGHDDISTTLRSYSHLMPEDQERAASVMESILAPDLPCDTRRVSPK